MPRLPLVIVLCLVWSSPAWGLDQVVLKRDGEEIRIEGRVTVTATDGGMLLVTRDGTLWTVQPTELVEHTHDETPFVPFTPDELGAKLLTELPGFSIHKTAHYMICYDTSRAYASWCGWLFERLYMAFENYWGKQGFECQSSEFPLTAIVFSDRRAYVRFSQPVLGEAAESIIGYFDQRSNRVVMYDLTGMEASGSSRSRVGTLRQIQRILAQPRANRAVATMVHEATHQIAFNSGMHSRYSDCPVWFSEGIAVYFEAPDSTSRTGWGNLGQVNRSRLVQFRDYFRRRPSDSLKQLIIDDTRFRDSRRSPDAYAEAWALTYFLMRRHRDAYVEYIRMLSKKRPLFWDTPEQRLVEFQKTFGDDIEAFDREFLQYMSRVR